MLKAVIFDIDGVLADSLEANLVFFQDLMKKTGYKPPTRKEYIPIFHLNMKDAVKHLTQSDSTEEVERIWKMGFDREVRYPLELITLPINTKETLEVLNKKYLLAIVTSRIRNSVFEIPQLAMLQDFFKVSIAYEDTVNHKPHPEPLLLAAKKLNLKPSEIVYIGDAESDVKAAKAANMKIATYPKLLEGADGSISSFSNLPKLVESLI